MAASPQWKVFDSNGEYIASFKSVYDAAQFIALEDGRELRFGHSKKNTVWVQNYTTHDAGESYDAVAEAAYEKLGVAA